MKVEELLAALQALPSHSIIPNEAQRAVMLHDGGPLWVIAGPGTGKTQALILRCLRLLCVEKISPSAILLTTYTRKAALQLQQRLQETLHRLHAFFPEIEQIDLTSIRLGTIHSLCMDLLQSTPASPFRHIHLLDEVERILFVMANSSLCTSQAMDDAIVLDLLNWAEQPDNPPERSFLPSRWDRARIFINLFQRLIEDGINQQQLAASAPHLRVLCDIIAEYREQLQAHHFTDYTLIQQQTLEWLSSPAGKAFLQGNGQQPGIQHVIVDEYQDTNPLQALLYRALAENAPHQICVVGDDDQALYRFRGGTVTCMVRFAEECQRVWPGCLVRQIALTQTYRSHPAIVEWINAFITTQPSLKVSGARVENKPRLQAMRPAYIQGPVVYAIRGKNGNEVAASFAQLIAGLLTRQVITSPSQCALLAHSVRETVIQPYRDALLSQGIEMALPAHPREHPLYQQVVGTLLTVLDPLDIFRPITSNDQQFGNFLEICRDTCKGNAALTSFAQKLHSWLLGITNARHQQSLSYILEYILNHPECSSLIEQSPQALEAAQILRDLVEAYDQIVEEGKAQIPMASGQDTIASWWTQRLYSVLARILFTAIRPETSLERITTTSKSALPALTIHQSKGLEFPVVAVIVEKSGKRHDSVHQLERAVLPYRRDLVDIGDISAILGGDDTTRALQDTIRLYYVAYSRACELLLILTPDSLWKPPVAPGLGGEQAWFSQYVRQWPAKLSSARQKKAAPSSKKEGYLHDLWEGL
ncbi:MAG TPA: ATP-dependent helicase [Ktedonobacteraceae bacterium]|nr:ATP-dependent helicase [Ktedonobacteraceae bacterium]